MSNVQRPMSKLVHTRGLEASAMVEQDLTFIPYPIPYTLYPLTQGIRQIPIPMVIWIMSNGMRFTSY